MISDAASRPSSVSLELFVSSRLRLEYMASFGNIVRKSGISSPFGPDGAGAVNAVDVVVSDVEGAGVDPDKENPLAAGVEVPPKEMPPPVTPGAGAPVVPGAGVFAAVDPNVNDGVGAPPTAGVAGALVVADPNVGAAGVAPGAAAGWEPPRENPGTAGVCGAAGAPGAGVAPKVYGAEALEAAGCPAGVAAEKLNPPPVDGAGPGVDDPKRFDAMSVSLLLLVRTELQRIGLPF